ncbi:oxidized low-density lipoprotein receptor 1-like [Chrysoperla carnea]|uniref:oxidized low-density lipoprotein receptor 1-like n=1 Tax=Chrysoperla carnea TaxID=189513 RepID=UPI001D083B64|nr:oxidized low-density lipoprotein receptor 1-like [Chrysoperla carnea]
MIIKKSVHCLIILSFLYCCVNSTDTSTNDNNDVWDTADDGVFGPLLEKYTLSYENYNLREGKVLHIPKTEGGFVASRITILNDTRPGKIVNRPIPTVMKPQIPNNPNNPVSVQSPGREVSETDLYLLSAFEKMAYKVDIMEKRLRHVEEIMYSVVAGNKIDTEPCPLNFTRAGEGCYYFGERKFDWQVANKYCKRMGASLVEFETIEERESVISYIQSWSYFKGRDFWTSGLNPGLLWIWSGSAKPVMNKPNSSEIRGSGRCLGVVYDPSYRRYNYRGVDCSMPQYFICEQEDKTLSNGISRLAKQLN